MSSRRDPQQFLRLFASLTRTLTSQFREKSGFVQVCCKKNKTIHSIGSFRCSFFSNDLSYDHFISSSWAQHECEWSFPACAYQTSASVKAMHVCCCFFHLSNPCVLVPAALVLSTLSFIVCHWDDILSQGRNVRCQEWCRFLKSLFFAKRKWVNQSHRAHAYSWGCKKSLRAPSQTVPGAN